MTSSAHSLTPSPARERQILLVITLMSFTNVVDFMVMMPLSPHLMREFGIDTTQFGLLVSAYAFAASASSLLMASIADRFDRKHALLVVYAGLIVGTLGCALAPNYAALLTARTIAGLFGGVQGSIAFSIVGDLVPDERRGRAMGLVMLSMSLSAVLGVPLSIYVAAHGGWHVPFFALAATCALLFVVALRLIPNMRGHMRAASHAGLWTGLWRGYAELLRVRNHWWAFATSALLTLSGMIVIPYIAPSRITNEGMSEVQLAYFYLVGGAVTLFSRPLFGRMSDRYPRAIVYYWLVLLSIAPMLLITHTLGVNLFWQLVVAALFFIFVSGRFIPSMALVTAASTPQLRGRVMSFNSAVQNLFTGLAAVIGGAMLSHTAGGSLAGFEAVGLLSCLFALASLWTAFKIRTVS